MGRIVAIGGGEIADHETLPIDRRIVELADTAQPYALFLPTASGDAAGYIDTFHRVYEDLGCTTDVLTLTADPAATVIEESIAAADIIYVGGGNTRKMMQIWTEHGVNDLLRQAYRAGTVLSGLSAGAICWFEAGHSDSESFDADGDWDYIRVDGLNLVKDLIFCPHYHSEDRVAPFHNMMRNHPENMGLAADDCAAIQIVDGEVTILSADSDAHAYRVYLEADRVVEERLDGSFPLAALQR